MKENLIEQIETLFTENKDIFPISVSEYQIIISADESTTGEDELVIYITGDGQGIQTVIYNEDDDYEGEDELEYSWDDLSEKILREIIGVIQSYLPEEEDDEEVPYGSIVQDLRDGDSAILIGLGENNNTKWNGMVGTLENNGKTLRLDTGHTFSVNNENWRITNLIV